ncbi:FlgK-like flagellar hook-associated protein [Octadecabacter antarcticus 307]|uniref:Flagellar hook-associated protein 1 n=1 Tax=Octadecabacter antarcticus 307 TaxID=391626 RepID=M9RFF2_9RHOB|nr:flagellar basal body rod C-terminal domain-containing protein [Octadecabacter antarcticus]AGI68540.1 FlgK-like flagellar hook-associated protein [Octadecabacter antarcticus 307]
MASLFEIGRSAINAQRQALNVTGQNIVNANTEGYRRRDANLTEVFGVQSELNSMTSQVGLGVKLGVVNRAYDAFLTDTKRVSVGRFEASDAFVGKLESLENAILPNDGDLGAVMTAFFEQLRQVSAEPGDNAPRSAAVEMGHTVANAFNNTANLLGGLAEGTVEEIEIRLVEVNRNLEALSVLNGQLRASNIGANPPNSLMDERDRILDNLSEVIPLNVSIGGRFDAEVRLGGSTAGPIILSGEDAKNLTVVASEQGSIMLRIGSGQIVSQLEAGSLRGLVDAHGTTQRAVMELDALARDFTQKMNAQHSQGIDLDGQLGRELFSVVDFEVSARTVNQGDAEASIYLVPGRADRLSDMQMTYDAKRGQWQLSNETGETLGTGRGRIELDGAVIDVTGTPEDGDVISFALMAGEASRMSFLLTRGEELAAASRTVVYPATTNSGSAVLTTSQDTAPESGVPSLANILSNNLSPVAAQEFLRGGVVASIPRGTNEITLASLATQTTASVSAELDANIRSISATVDGVEYSFTLNPNSVGIDAWETGSEIAHYLSMGVLRSGDATSNVMLKDLGITVSGSESGLALASDGSQAFTALSATSSSGGVLGTDLSLGEEASDIRIFTREGRQIAGSPLHATEVAKFLTVENGFSESAEYRSDHNTVDNNASYRGLSIIQRISNSDPMESGLQSTMSSLTGLRGSNLNTISTNPTGNATQEQTITLEMETGATGSLSIPPGVDAAYVSERANKAFAAVGVSTMAQTAVRISLAGAASGQVQFNLTSTNQTPVTVSAQVNNGNLSELVESINRRSGDTGVTAELSLSSSDITLLQADGFDVVIQDITSEIALTVGALDQDFNPLPLDNSDSPETFLSFGDDLRFSGTLSFHSGSSFSLTTSAVGQTNVALNSAADPMIGGLVERTFTNGGTQAALSFGFDNRIDGVSQSVDGTRVQAPSSLFETRLTMADDTSFNAMVSSSNVGVGVMNGASIAEATALQMRAQSPVPMLEGVGFSLDAIPEIGASALFELGGAEYTLTRVDDGNADSLTALDFEITGPEIGRIRARVNDTDEGYSLSLVVADGQLAGTGPRPVIDTAASVFGLSNSQASLSVQGRAFDAASMTAGSYTMDITVKGGAETVTFDIDSSGISLTSVSDSAALSAEIDFDASTGLSIITLTSQQAGADAMVITPSSVATNLGFKLAAAELSVENGQLFARSTNGSAVDIKSGGTSAAGSYLHLTDIPDEELLVMMGLEGAKRLSAQYEIGVPVSAEDREPESFRVQMMDDNSGRVELFDNASGASIATRMSSGFARFNVSDQMVELSGFAESGDSFEFITGQRSAGDSRNMDMLLAFGQQGSDRRSFQDDFRTIAAGAGATLEAARMTLSSNEAVRDAAVASEGELSGVSLDEEAAKLMSQQQAFQAAARILQTAREMFDTLIRIT